MQLIRGEVKHKSMKRSTAEVGLPAIALLAAPLLLNALDLLPVHQLQSARVGVAGSSSQPTTVTVSLPHGPRPCCIREELARAEPAGTRADNGARLSSRASEHRAS